MILPQNPQHTPIDLWNGTGVKAHVRLTPFVAPDSDGTACIVCPGGSYFWLDRKNEGINTARWLRDNGITAFLLEYRTSGIPAFLTRFRLNHHESRAMRSMQDVFMAIDYVKKNARVWNVNPALVGVLGFSAGGHMALMAAEKTGNEILANVNISTTADLRPAFVGAIYPVVSFVSPYTHKRSRRGLIGDFHGHHNILRQNLSAELNTTPSMSPVFLVSCDDDTVVDPRNAQLLNNAMLNCGAEIEYHRYRTGGHGFGATDTATSTEAATWKQSFLRFIARHTHRS